MQAHLVFRTSRLDDQYCYPNNGHCYIQTPSCSRKHSPPSALSGVIASPLIDTLCSGYTEVRLDYFQPDR